MASFTFKTQAYRFHCLASPSSQLHRNKSPVIKAPIFEKTQITYLSFNQSQSHGSR